jgi:hypothetical protein
MSIRTPFAALCLILLMAGSASAQKVTTDSDKSANWSAYNTYYSEIPKPFGTQLSQQRALAAVDSALKARGWTKVATLDSASAVVLINGVVQQEQTATTMYTGGGYSGWGYRGGAGMGMSTATTSTQQYNVGTLVVDIFDTKTKQLLFRGQGQKTISDKSEKNTEALYSAAAKMFKDFPPTASK